MNRCLFLDRDGVINIDSGYVYRQNEFIFREEIFDICKYAISLNFKIIVITNQAGIGRGIFSESDYIKITNYMISIFNQKTIDIDEVYYCPYHKDFGKGRYKRDSFLRKPNPGMLNLAIEKHLINPKCSLMIGDKDSDKLASKLAGIFNYVDAKHPKWDQLAKELLKRISEDNN